MTKDEAIEVIEETIDDLCDGRILDLVPVRVSALEVAIESLKQNQWIPCERELPEPYDDVIISAKGYVCEANLRESKEYFLTHNARMFIKTEETDAWMQLPKPYEGR